MSKQGVGRYFVFIKNNVSSDWKDLAWCLGFATPDIDNIDGKRRDDKSRCMELLQEWHKRRGNTATIHVLMEALKDAQLQLVVDSLKDKYPELNEKQKSQMSSFALLPDLPVHLNLGVVQQETAARAHTGDIDALVSKRLLELERTLFTEDVLKDRRRYKRAQQSFLSHKAFLLKEAVKGSFILLLTFLRQTDVDRFYHNHYRVGEGSLSQQLSHILISDDLQDKVKGAQLIVRLQVKHEDYVRVRDRLGQGLDRTTSADNLLALPPLSRHVDHSSLRGLDLAVIGREDQPCTDGTDDITTPYRQVQSAVRTTREKSKQEMKGQREMMQGQVAEDVKMLKEQNEKAERILLEQKEEMKEKIQQLQETNKSLEAIIYELLTAKQPEGGTQQQYPMQTMLDQHSMDNPTATITEQVRQSVVQPKRKDTNVRPIRVGRPWVRKVRFGGSGSGRGEFFCPWGVAVSQDNEVYVADWDNTRIQVFTMDGVYIREFITTLPGETGEMSLLPEDVAVDRNDNLWVVSGEHVVQYSREGTCLVIIDLPYVGYLRGITVSMATEQVIVTEYDGENGQLQVFNQDGSEVGTWGSGQSSPEPWWPQSVTVDGEGNILVTDVNNHCVHVWDGEGNFKFNFGSEESDESQFKYPRGICVDGKGNIIVADSGNGCVKVFDSQGRFLCHIGSGMKHTWAVAVSPGGDVVVTDCEDDTVSVWTQG
ncbi:PREDICTED: uncharacterized protein LOC109483912 [Branchiostoma belcheri]|uniref:Uncharacterized protein LOC109483912 n=1 Tax=Branchiostoma belcheri TaxID=7741 RepID=A0A6P5AKQ8_BRABE|nr:PREDICTED: uncharacterized protein LOC109483912 [Branchiostoma belcheri]